MKSIFLLALFISVYSVSNAQRPKYYSVPQIKGYFTYYKNNTINYTFNDTLNAAFNKYNDYLYRIIFYSRRKVLTKCDCIYKGVEIKQYANIAKGATGGKVVRDSFYVRQLTLKDTNCLKVLPGDILRKTK